MGIDSTQPQRPSTPATQAQATTEAILSSDDVKDTSAPQQTTDPARRARRKTFTLKATARDFGVIAVGTLLVAVALDIFLVPGQLAAGGASGLATIIYYVTLEAFGFPLPIGAQTLVMNALLMIPVIKSGGWRYAARTVWGIVTLSVFTDLLAPFISQYAPSDIIICCLWGGLVSGLGLGLAFKVGGNTGGTDIVAQLLSRHTNITVGTWMIIVDALVIAASIPVFGFEAALCATLTVIVTSLVIDYVVDGPSTEKAAWIVSPRNEQIADAVVETMGLGATEFKATSAHTGQDRTVLFVVVSRKDMGDLKRIVAELDPNALMAIADMHETFGRSFKDIQPE